MKKLLKIQSDLKAPKGQFNNFGKYKYRSCEDIMEAVKPHLQETKCVLTISDTIENIGERYYIKATAKLTCTETQESIEVTGYAREEENKKGMDGSQITGASSSYARKYALNGLFAIDDTKDSDGTNTHGKEEKKTDNLEKLKKKIIELGNDTAEKANAFLKEKGVEKTIDKITEKEASGIYILISK